MILPPKFDDSCVLWLDFASVKNNTVYDQSGNNNHGTVYGAQHIGRFGLHGLHFDGVDDYVEIPRTNFPTITNKVTLIACVKLDVLREMEPAIFLSNQNYQAWIWTPRCADGRLEFGVYTDKSYYVYTSRKIEAGKCYCVALTYDGDLASNNLKGYVNGELWAQGNATGDLRASTEPVYLALWRDVYLKGNIYFVALYNRALSDAEIRELYYYLTKGIRSIVPSRFVARKVG